MLLCGVHLSVRLSVTFVYFIEKTNSLFSNFFHRRVATPFYTGRQKLHPFIFAVALSNRINFDNFWHTDTEVNLQQSRNRIAHLSWWVYLPYPVKYNVIMFITKAHLRCLTSFSVSDKRILEWLFISCSVQDWGLVYGEDTMSGVKSGVLCRSSSVLLRTRGARAWNQKSPAAWQMSGSNCLSSKTSQ